MKPKREIKRGVPQQTIDKFGNIINVNKGRRWVEGRKHWDGEKRDLGRNR